MPVSYWACPRISLASDRGVSRLTLRLWEASGDEPPNALAPNLSRVLRYLHSEGVKFGGDGTVHLVDAPVPTALNDGAAA